MNLEFIQAHKHNLCVPKFVFLVIHSVHLLEILFILFTFLLILLALEIMHELVITEIIYSKLRGGLRSVSIIVNPSNTGNFQTSTTVDTPEESAAFF